MGVKNLGHLAFAGVVSFFGISAVHAAVTPTEVVTLPSDDAYGGGDRVGSQLVAATYNAGKGPGIWIVADGGYRLYHNGVLLAEDNQAGRVRFIPMTFLPGENAISVVGVNGAGAPGVMVQIDELDKSYYSGSGWKSKPSVSDNKWKNKGRDLSQWGSATTLSYASDKMPSGGALNGFAANTQAKWIWTSAEADPTAVLLFTFYVKAEGFGASTTGGDAGKIVIASDSATIRKHLQSTEAVTILVPEGTYDFRRMRNAVTEANAAGRTWCRTTCGETNRVTGKTNKFYRIAFEKNSCASLGESGLEIVKESDNLQAWSNWITTKPNKSLVGMGRGANLRGASIVVRSYEGSGNHIYRNLAIYDVNPHLIEGGDGLETVGSASNHVKKFWADHISYKWISDGMDMEFVDDATISYLDFDGANEYNCWGTDPYMALVEDAHLTYANNYWHNTYGRVPKVTGESNGSQVHLYNQYVDYNRFFIAGANGHSANAKAYVRYENSYIDNGQGYLAEWGDNGYVYFSGVTLGSGTKQQHRYNGTVTQGVPNAATFNPSYSFEKRTVANLPKEIPSLVGVGGRYGKMPEYNQAFGMSPVAASVTVVANPSKNAVSLTASVKNNSGASIKKVDFFIGTTLVGSATSSPYTVNVADVSGGTYSAIAVATDANGLEGVSAYMTFNVSGEHIPTVGTLTKNGAGSSNQQITLGESIVAFSYVWGNSEGVTVTGLPNGVSYSINESENRVSISGTPTEAGEYVYTIVTVGADSNASVVRTISVIDPNAPASSSSVAESSSESSTTGIQSLNLSTEAETGFYRIFDMQGRPLFAGEHKPAKMPAARVIVVEYTKNGALKRRYIQ
jgi:hypothetical protein